MTSYLDDNDIPDWARPSAEKAEQAGFGLWLAYTVGHIVGWTKRDTGVTP